MDPIKPIEGTVSNAQEQALSLTEVMREHYWRQQAEQATHTVVASDKSVEVAVKREKQPTKKAPVQVSNSVHNTYAEFTVDRDSHKVIVRIIDGNSGELVRTIPPEDLAKEIAKGRLSQNQIRRRSIRL